MWALVIPPAKALFLTKGFKMIKPLFKIDDLVIDCWLSTFRIIDIKDDEYILLHIDTGTKSTETVSIVDKMALIQKKKQDFKQQLNEILE